MMNKIFNDDWMRNNLQDKSVQLIIADPPYFETKGDFDFKWLSFQDYLKDVEVWAVECKRVLAENGTLFWFGSSKNIAYSQVVFDKYFGLINNLVWEKAESDGLFGSTGSEQLRSFPNSTERILMYSNEIKRTGLETIKLDISNFKTLRKYFKDLQYWMGLSLNNINNKLGHRRAEHAFYHSSTQWDLPTLETYNEFVELFKICNYKNYIKYEDLRKEYEDLRRPFKNYSKSTEVLKIRFELSQYEHDTVKPEKLAALLINTCSRKKDLVFVPFVGSGTECESAYRYGRNFIGYETDEKYYKIAKQRLKNEMSQIKMEL